jgi:tripartite ATP-independent transporter DctM subunit
MRQMPRAEKLRAMKGLILPMAVIVWVLGSIYGGIASVTEAAGVGVFGAALAALARGRLSWPMLQGALRQTMVTVGTIIWLILGAVSLVGIYNIIGGNTFMQNLLSGLDLPPLGIIFVMMAILVVLGTFMEWIAIVFITVPIFAPVVTSLGFDPIWFGILVVCIVEIGMISPPVGMNIFVLRSVLPDVPTGTIWRGVMPFLVADVFRLAVLIAFPAITLWLPRALGL